MFLGKSCRREASPRLTALSTTEKALSTQWQVPVLLLAVLLLCYHSVLVTPYGFLDDYGDLAGSLRGVAWAKTKKTMEGRPVYAFLEALSLSYMSDIGDLRYLRFLSVFGITLVSWSLYRSLGFVGWSRYQALCLSVMICTLPPFQVYAAWAVTAFYPFAAAVSGLAFSLAHRAFEERHTLYKWGLTGGSVLLMLLALTIHQSAAMFFWVFAAIVLFQPQALSADVLRRFGWYNAIVFTALLLGFGVYQWGMAIHGHRLPPQRSHLTHDIVGKADWFLHWPLGDALNLANLFPTRWLALSVAVFSLGGLLLYFRGACRERLLKLMIALFLLPLSYLPNLVVAESWSSYRTQAGLTSVITIYAFLALWGYRQVIGRFFTASVLSVGLGVAALGSSLLAAHNVRTYFATPQFQELKCMRSLLADKDLWQARSLYVVKARCQDAGVPQVRYDEFGFSSSLRSPSPIVYLLLREIHPERASLPISVVSADGPINPPSDAFVVDMRQLSSSP